jgi:hypothetical protein
MRNLYRSPSVRADDAAAPVPYYDYAAKVARDRIRIRRQLFAMVGIFCLAPGVIALAAGAGAGRALQYVLGAVAYLCGRFAFNSALIRLCLPMMKRQEKATFAAKKLAADTEAFLNEQEDAAMKTRVFLRPATPDAPPQELATEPPPSERKLTAA